MKKRLLTHWYFHKNLYINFLAHSDERQTSKEALVWAYYRLGMFNSVLAVKVSVLTWKTLFSKIIANVALGQKKQALELIQKLDQCQKCQEKMELLISGLLAYMPEQAYALNQKQSKKSLFEIVLLMRLGKSEKALEKSLLKIHHKEYKNEPELLLLFSNLQHELTLSKKSDLLNQYLFQYQLTPLTTVNPSLPIYPDNLTSNEECMKSEGKLVSVIMTSYNSEQVIETALKSILLQSYTNLEIIVVDDASTDTTVSIVEEVMKSDRRVRLIKLQENVGTYVAKNRALSEAKGYYVTCHDSDDYSHPLKIERQVMPLEKNSKLVASISDWVRVDENGSYYTRYLYPLMRMNLSSLLFRREKVCKSMGIYDSVRTGADSEFFSRLGLVFGKKAVKRVRQPLSLGAHREASLMTSTETGYNEKGISKTRLEYWEAWNHWHINETRLKRVPKILAEDIERKFDAPKAIVVTTSVGS